MIEPRIAVQLYTLRDFTQTTTDFVQTLKKVRSIGYQAIQVSGIGSFDPAYVKEIADNEGLTICATHIGFDRLKNDIDGVIQQHHLWNCNYVGIGSMPENYRNSREGYLQFAQDASLYGKQLKENGLTLIYHNHNFEFSKFDDRIGMEILIDESDPEALQFEVDTYWVQAGGADPIEWIRRLKGRMDVVHLKDMALTHNCEQIMAEVGEGNLNWKGILSACREIGVQWCPVEQDICQRDPFESLTISKRNLEQYGCQF